MNGSPVSDAYVQFSYDIVMKGDGEVDEFIREPNDANGISNVKFVASCYDADY